MGPSLAVSKHERGDETGKSLREGLICRTTRNPGSLALLHWSALYKAKPEPLHTNDWMQPVEIYFIWVNHRGYRKVLKLWTSSRMCNQLKDTCRGTCIDWLNARDRAVRLCHVEKTPLRGLRLEISPYSWCKWDHCNYSSHTFVEASVIWRGNRIMLKALGVI